MVDPVSGSGNVQNILGTNRTTQSTNNTEGRRNEEARGNTPRDEVNISQEALSLADAEGATAQLRAFLEEYQEQSLGLDPNFDTEA